MTTQHPLDQFSGPMQTSMGQAFPGERVVFRGHDLHHNLNDMTWLELHLFGITGRRFNEKELRLLDMIWQVTSYPEPRIWNNRVAALAGSARATSTQAFSAASAATEAKLFGLQVQHMCGDFLFRTKRSIDEGNYLDEIIEHELKTHKYIKGFGRPIAADAQDERIPAIFKVLADQGLQQGKYTDLVFQVEKSLNTRGLNFRPNYAIFASSLPMDIGLSVRELICYLYTVVLAGMPPVYLEALQRPEGATFPIKCCNINYSGAKSRKWSDFNLP